MGWLNGRGGSVVGEVKDQPPLRRADGGTALGEGRSGSDLSGVAARVEPLLIERIDPGEAGAMTRGELAKRIKTELPELLAREWAGFNLLEQRDLVTQMINRFLTLVPKADSGPAPGPAASSPEPTAPADEPSRSALDVVPSVFPEPPTSVSSSNSPDTFAAPVDRQLLNAGAKSRIAAAKQRVQSHLLDRIDAATAASMTREDLVREMTPIVAELLAEEKLQLNMQERAGLIEELLDDMLGLGPLEPLLADESINDIMVNGPKQIYIERKGKLQLADVTFRDDSHVMQVATRIVTAVGRRIDESVPLVDARLADGSRVNIIVPPLAIDGPSISIRKFAKKGITLDVMARQANISPDMATVLRIAARARLNILISGGTGSGKTTLLNALSQMIDPGERVVTIEDAAELQLQQPHVVRLETRPANLEGKGEISMRDLVKNSLRMRPDRIILGEIRSAEAIDMLQAMNTGHDGSLSTIHANRPREALMRLENMVSMSGFKLPSSAVRSLIASAIDVIIQISRMRDGVRRVTYISEVVGMEGEVITMQDLFSFAYAGEGPDGKLQGTFKSHGIRPHFTEKASYFGLERALLEAT
ncbi:CpaF family protein [Algihabitans albus]|uniref:CpaF family protein n=1 Tax=Algihabitans albus TaxID=2164067 RepID=UPI001F258B99|nr:CpaF family protein [Algihabitans albus]